MTRAVKETPVLTVLHELKERVKRTAKPRSGTLALTMRETLKMIEDLEDEERLALDEAWRITEEWWDQRMQMVDDGRARKMLDTATTDTLD